MSVDLKFAKFHLIFIMTRVSPWDYRKAAKYYFHRKLSKVKKKTISVVSPHSIIFLFRFGGGTKEDEVGLRVILHNRLIDNNNNR